MRTICTAMLAIFSLPAPADEFSLEWHTVDASGTMMASTGDLVLFATLGQPDVTPVVMTGHGYTLVGGFWPGAYSTIFGDCDNSWNVSAADCDSFFSCLQGPDTPTSNGCSCLNPDSDGDDDCDLRDLAAFQSVFIDQP